MKDASGWKIASIRGIDLRLHFSLIFLLFYVVLVAAAQLPFVAAQAGIDSATLAFGPWTWGLIFAVSLFTSVVLHEFGHALTAQALGMKVRNITLMMLGGVSMIEHMPDKPASEFKVAIVGPLVSFALSALFFVALDATESPSFALFCYWLGSTNLVLGIFNLLPAFPLDGGRVLRAALASRQGMVRGTQSAVKVSRVFAWILGLLGLLQFNFLLMLIAVVVYFAAQQELYVLMSRGLLKGITAGDLAVRLAPLSERESLQAAAEKMIRARKVALPVETLSGPPAIVTLAGIRRVPSEEWQTTTVGAAMNEVPVLASDAPIGQSVADLAASPAGALPVEEGGHVIGLVLYSDLAELLQLKSLETPPEEKPPRAA